MGRPRKVIGGEVRSDAPAADVQQLWKTDVIEGQDPDFSYQFMREDEVRDRGRSKFVMDRRIGKPVKVPGWQVVSEDEVNVSRERPDLAAPVDTAMRMGPHVLMKIPRDGWDLLQHEKDAIPDAIANRLLRGQTELESPDESQVTFTQKPFAVHPALMGGLQRT